MRLPEMRMQDKPCRKRERLLTLHFGSEARRGQDRSDACRPH
jgi:hypothetical protein